MEEEIKNYFLFYEEKLLPVILKRNSVTQQKHGYHGLLTHTEGVVFRGIYYALSLKKNPYPVIFACAGHDLARVNDCEDFEHGPNAVPIITEIMEEFNDILTDKEKEEIKEAIKYHSIGTQAPDYISACLRDADRTRLSWGGRYNEKYFNTEIGKKIASGKAKDFLEFENKCLGRKKYTDNEEVLRYEDFIEEL